MSSVSWAVRKMIFTSGLSRWMASAAVIPACIVSISISIRMMSQSVSRASRVISWPVAAQPATSIPGARLTISQKSSRSRGISSATITRIGCRSILPHPLRPAS